jgi:tRNA threonylcarbamoyl adenosine modification protein (Sua5/YciO/YrdC/YwlC family)
VRFTVHLLHLPRRHYIHWTITPHFFKQMSVFTRQCSTTTMSFEDIRACLKSDRSDVLGRSEQSQKEYRAAMEEIKGKYAKLSDFILCSKFGRPESVRGEDGKVSADQRIGDGTRDGANERVVWSLNDFPYNFSSDVVSYIVWKFGEGGNVKITQEEIDGAVRGMKSQLGGKYKEHLWFESASHLKSIPDLAHVHVLVQVNNHEELVLQKYRQMLLPPSEEGYSRAAALLQRGKLVAFPTETVYGLGANALDADAVLSIFTAKGRPLTDPLIVHVPTAQAALPLINPTSEESRRVFLGLGERFWPGPLTIIVRASEAIPPAVTANTGSVGIRVPAHPMARRLLETCRLPVAAPSANRFGHVSPTTAAHVLADLGERNVHCLNGEAQEQGQGQGQGTSGSSISGGSGSSTNPSPAVGSCEHGIESTVVKVDPATKTIMLFRQGAVTKAHLEAALRDMQLRWDSAGAGADGGWDVQVVRRTVAMHGTDKKEKQEGGGEGQEAPGQAVTHYAPDVPCALVHSTTRGASKAASDTDSSSSISISGVDDVGKNVLALSVSAFRDSAVVLDFQGTLMRAVSALRGDDGAPFLAYWDLSPSGDYAEAARSLFAALRWAEIQPGAQHILIAATTAANPNLSQQDKNGCIGKAAREGDALKAGFEDRVFRATSGNNVELVVE